METKKVEKLKKMLADAEKRNETIIVNLYKEVLPTVKEVASDEEFDSVVFKKIQELAISASAKLKKKEQSLAEQEIYCLSLLSHCFFDRKIEVSIVKDKVKLVDNRN